MSGLYKRITRITEDEINVRLSAKSLCLLIDQIESSPLKDTIVESIVQQVKTHVDLTKNNFAWAKDCKNLPQWKRSAVYTVTCVSDGTAMRTDNRQLAVDWAIEIESNGAPVTIYNNETLSQEYCSPVYRLNHGNTTNSSTTCSDMVNARSNKPNTKTNSKRT